MPTIITRAGKGSDLTPTEADSNFKKTVRQLTSSGAGLISDNRGTIEANHAATPVAVTLLAVATAAAAQPGDYSVTITNIGAAAATVDGNSTETINGATATLTLAQYSSVTVEVDSAGTGWQITARTGDVGVITALAGFTIGTVTSWASTDDVGDNFPSGTDMLFYQTAAPTGWTKNTTAGLNDHALRIMTSGAWTGGTQGTTAFSTQFAQGFGGENYTLLEADIPSHSHVQNSGTVNLGETGSKGGYGIEAGYTTDRNATNVTGGGGAHAHDVNLGVKYLDMIIAAKD